MPSEKEPIPEKILTLHPQGKKGVNILRSKYDPIRTFIETTVRERGEITYAELNDLAVETLSPTFEGRVNWYLVTIKLDLEARGVIERVPKTSPHRVRMVER